MHQVWGGSVCTRSAPDLHQICTRSAPDLHQTRTRSAPDLHQVGLHQICTRFAPDLYHICTRSAPGLVQTDPPPDLVQIWCRPPPEAGGSEDVVLGTSQDISGLREQLFRRLAGWLVGCASPVWGQTGLNPVAASGEPATHILLSSLLLVRCGNLLEGDLLVCPYPACPAL